METSPGGLAVGAQAGDGATITGTAARNTATGARVIEDRATEATGGLGRLTAGQGAAGAATKARPGRARRRLRGSLQSCSGLTRDLWTLVPAVFSPGGRLSRAGLGATRLGRAVIATRFGCIATWFGAWQVFKASWTRHVITTASRSNLRGGAWAGDACKAQNGKGRCGKSTIREDSQLANQEVEADGWGAVGVQLQ